MNFKSFINTLTQTLNWHKDRCETFKCMVMGLIDQGNVQHHALATPLKTQGTLVTFPPMIEKVHRAIFWSPEAAVYMGFLTFLG